jgi:hypothetical protein
MRQKPEDGQGAQSGICGCCAPDSGEQGDASGCTGGQTVLTLEEQHILARIRELQQEGQRLKEAIRNLASARGEHPDLAKLQGDLDALREERAVLEERRVLAARERMRRLGHEDP